MSTFAEPRSGPPGYELPYPPAVTRREEPPGAPDDDVVPMPPFSGARLQLLNPDEVKHALAFEELVPIMETPTTTPAAPPAPLPTEVPVPEPATAASAVSSEPEAELAREVAARLEELAGELRRQGFHALLKPRSEQEPIDVVLASVIAGFLAGR